MGPSSEGSFVIKITILTRGGMLNCIPGKPDLTPPALARSSTLPKALPGYGYVPSSLRMPNESRLLVKKKHTGRRNTEEPPRKNKHQTRSPNHKLRTTNQKLQTPNNLPRTPNNLPRTPHKLPPPPNPTLQNNTPTPTTDPNDTKHHPTRPHLPHDTYLRHLPHPDLPHTIRHDTYQTNHTTADRTHTPPH